MCAMRLVSKKENPVSALLASESREHAKRFIDIRVLSTEGIEDEIDVLRKLAKDYYEVCDENVKLKKNIYDINNELNHNVHLYPTPSEEITDFQLKTTRKGQ